MLGGTNIRTLNASKRISTIPTMVEVNPLVKMPHLYITRLFLSHLIGEVAQSLTGQPQEIHQLCVVGMSLEHLNQGLHKPGALLLIPQAGIPRNSAVCNNHVLPSGPAVKIFNL